MFLYQNVNKATYDFDEFSVLDDITVTAKENTEDLK